jgi:hypothetical protein
LLLDLFDRLFELANVFARELSGFGKLRHHRLGAPAEKAEDFVEKTVARNVTRDGRFENVCIADLADAVDRLLPF